jgi:hypothetical protein
MLEIFKYLFLNKYFLILKEIEINYNKRVFQRSLVLVPDVPNMKKIGKKQSIRT